MNQKRFLISSFSSLIGNALEWYEYTLYAYFATVISGLFFPMESKTAGMILTFATFAVGLAARPIGGIIFGYIGDRYSRKKMLTITMLLMSVPTMCIGLLPTYSQIGIFAPTILILLRIVQGIALGGEFGASCVYLYEAAPPGKKGFFGTLALTGVGTGLVLSSCTILVLEMSVTAQQIQDFAWRIPFFVSVIGSLVAFYMRRNLEETNDFIMVKNQKAFVKNPLAEMFKNHKSALLGLFGIFLTTQISFFVVFIFGKTMMIDFLGYQNCVAGKFSLFTVLSYTASTIIFGYLSTKIDKRKIILIGMILLFCSAYPFVWSLKLGSSGFILLMSLFLGALIGMTEGTLNPLVAESFPPNIRATSVAFCWNFTSVAFGGCAPIISMWFIKYTGQVDCVAYYLMLAALISVATLLCRFKKYRVEAEACSSLEKVL